EEIPTPIQSGSPQIAALRSKHAKPKDAGDVQAFSGVARTEPMLIDEDSDLRTTAIKKVDVGPLPARLLMPSGISDMDSEEFPTEPVRGADLARAGLRRPTQRSEPTRPAGLPPAAPGNAKATALDAPRVQSGNVAPPLPGVPPPPAPVNGASSTPL